MLKTILRTLMFVFQSFIIIAITGCTTTVSEKIPNTNLVAKATQTIEVAPTEVFTALQTETAFPTTEEIGTASTEWQISPDGHVYYKESELYGGMFTINEEHPEFVEKYWEDSIRGLYRLNYLSENKEFLEQFPSADALVNHIKNGGGPVGNLRIPKIYPSSSRTTIGGAAMYTTQEPVDLSAIGLSIYKPTEEESLAYIKYLTSDDYVTALTRSPFLAFQGKYAGILIEEKQIAGKNILTFTFRRDYLEDITGKNYLGETVTYYSLNPEKTPEDNLKGALQLILGWNYASLYGQTEPLPGGSDLPIWDTKPITSILYMSRMFGYNAMYDTFANSSEPPIIIR